MKSGGRTITVRVPIAIRKRGGRKVVLAPDGAIGDTRKLFCQQVDNAMAKAIARGFRWREMLETSACATIKEIAEAEKIAETYVGRVLRLTVLAPEIINAILTGKQPPETTLRELMRAFPIEWNRQRDLLRFPKLKVGVRLRFGPLDSK